MLGNRRGFTLLEVLVTVTLFAMVAGLLFSGYQVVARTWRTGNRRMMEAERWRSALDLFRRQVSCVYPVVPLKEIEDTGQPPSGQPFNPMSGGQPPSIPVGEVGNPALDQPLPYFEGDTQRVAFVSLYSLRLNALPGLCFVSYALESSREGHGMALVEYEKRYMGSNPTRRPGNKEFVMPEQVFRYVLVENLESASFEYFGMDMSKVGVVPDDQLTKEWFPAWQSEEKRDLPEAIRLRYRLLSNVRARVKDGEIVVPVHSQGNIRGMQPRRILNVGE